MKTSSEIVQKEIVPFNYDRTGNIERNKEFSGFIQQFISLKERQNMKSNENIIMKEISMNYFYISHPMYINLYSSVCGLTGTIGSRSDKNILESIYHLNTQKIPRQNPNRLYVFPTILCKSIEEKK